MDRIMLMASLALMVAGLASFVFGIINKKRYSGIGYKEFISSQYMVCRVPFSSKVSKRLILRRMEIADICEMGDIPNWLSILLAKGVTDKAAADKAMGELSAKSDDQLLKDSTDFYNVIQKLAERSIVGYSKYVEEWRKVDPEYTGRLPRITLDKIFEVQTGSLSKYIKKKNTYSVLRSLVNYTKSSPPPTSKA